MCVLTLPPHVPIVTAVCVDSASSCTYDCCVLILPPHVPIMTALCVCVCVCVLILPPHVPMMTVCVC